MQSNQRYSGSRTSRESPIPAATRPLGDGSKLKATMEIIGITRADGSFVVDHPEFIKRQNSHNIMKDCVKETVKSENDILRVSAVHTRENRIKRDEFLKKKRDPIRNYTDLCGVVKWSAGNFSIQKGFIPPDMSTRGTRNQSQTLPRSASRPSQSSLKSYSQQLQFGTKGSGFFVRGKSSINV